MTDVEVTPHELALLQAYMDRGNVKEAARDLGIAYQSAKNLLALIRTKLGVEITAQAVLILADKLQKPAA